MSCSECNQKFDDEEKERQRKLVCLYCKEGLLTPIESSNLLFMIKEGFDIEDDMLTMLYAIVPNCKNYWRQYNTYYNDGPKTEDEILKYCEDYPRTAKQLGDIWFNEKRTQEYLSKKSSKRSPKSSSRPRSPKRRSPGRPPLHPGKKSFKTGKSVMNTM